MYSRKEVKANARMQMGNNIFSNSWMMALLAVFLCTLINGAGSAIIPALSIVLVGPFTYALSKMFVKQARDHQTMEIGDIFCGFKECFGNAVLLNILMAIFVFLWTLLLIIPGMIKAYAYSMAYYIQADNPQMGAQECITQSRAMMKGHKWDLFVLDLSFIGWYFVGSLCFGIGILWVVPYHQAAHAQFYEAIRAKDDFSEQPTEV